MQEFMNRYTRTLKSDQSSMREVALAVKVWSALRSLSSAAPGGGGRRLGTTAAWPGVGARSGLCRRSLTVPGPCASPRPSRVRSPPQGFGFFAGAGKYLMKPDDMDIVVQEVVRKTMWAFSEYACCPPV